MAPNRRSSNGGPPHCDACTPIGAARAACTDGTAETGAYPRHAPRRNPFPDVTLVTLIAPLRPHSASRMRWTTAAARCSRRPHSPSSSPCATRFKPRSSSSTPAPKGEAGATDAPGEQQPTLASPGAVRGASRRALSWLDAGPEQSAGAELLAARAKKASASDRLRSLVAEQSRASG